MYCPNCNSDVESSVRMISETYPVKGEDITIEARVRFCDRCGKDLWDKQLDSQNLLDAFAEYRKRHNLLQPAQIRAVREEYGVSQAAFARILGLEDNAISRFESGIIADEAENNLIVLIQDPRTFAVLLEKSKDRISLGEYESVCRVLARLGEDDNK